MELPLEQKCFSGSVGNAVVADVIAVVDGLW